MASDTSHDSIALLGIFISFFNITFVILDLYLLLWKSDDEPEGHDCNIGSGFSNVTFKDSDTVMFPALSVTCVFISYVFPAVNPSNLFVVCVFHTPSIFIWYIVFVVSSPLAS